MAFIPYNASYQSWAPLVARLLLAMQLSAGSFFKIVAFPAQAAATASVGVPMPTVAVALALILEVLGILSLLSGYYVRLMGLLLALYVALLAVLFYHNWSDPMGFGLFMSHLGLIAALLYVSAYGAGPVAARRQ